jgi:putative toxin-antitoxin system antitoxin component (TIGR02293 family)
MEYDKKHSSPTSVNDAVSIYLKKEMPSTINFTNFSFKEFIENKLLVINSIRRGLSYNLFRTIVLFSPFSEEEWANYLDISSKSLQRYKKQDNFHFKSIHSEKILEIAEVTSIGKEIFDTDEQFYAWLNSPNFVFNKLTPAELLKDSYGKSLVLDELNRIEHGVFA